MNLEETTQRLAQMRDELKLQAHLFKAEARDEWHALEKSWQHFTAEVDRDARLTEDSEENFNAMLRTLAADVEEGFKTLLENLKDPLP